MTNEQRKANATAFRNAAEIIRTAGEAALFGDTCNDDNVLQVEARRTVVDTLEAWAVFAEKVR
jgi:hypothetical protein